MSRRGAAEGGKEGPRPQDGDPAPQANRAQGARGAPPVFSCPLCRETGGELIWQDDALRVVLPDEPDFPGFTRVVWNDHAAEMTDLPPPARLRLLDVVLAVESAMRAVLRPRKVNLASLGNAVPHLHWHVVPRFADDARFPGSPWSAPAAPAGPGAEAQAAASAEARRQAVRAQLPAYRAGLAEALDRLQRQPRATMSASDSRGSDLSHGRS